MLSSQKILIRAAKDLGIAYKILDSKNNLVQFQRSSHTTVIYKTSTDLNTTVACKISAIKSISSKILQKNGIPVQLQIPGRSLSQAQRIGQKIGFPLVVKPDVGSQGKGVTANITSQTELEKAVKKTLACSRHIVISKFYPGQDYRILVLKGRAIAAIKREPPCITGDGQKNIAQLIEEENQKRKQFNQKVGLQVYKKITFDSEARHLIEKNGLKLTSLLPQGQTLALKSVANCSSGGMAQTIDLKSFHPSIIQAAIQATKIIGLTLAAIDFILKDPQKPFRESNGVILETNSSPGLVPHYYPVAGRPQKIAPQILKALLG